MMYVLKLPYPTKSNNELVRMHWAAYQRHRREMDAIMQAERRKVGLLTAVGGERRKVVITRYGPRTLDHDNLVGGVKPLIDALRGAGVIWEDDPTHIDLEVHQRKSTGGHRHTRVEIYTRSV